MNAYSAVGNCVIIRLAKHDYAVLAHLAPHSFRVKVGDKVKPGQVLGKCGNSGNSSEPHLHFHLQNTAALQDGTGFPAYFRGARVIRDGKAMLEKEYRPIKDDRAAQLEGKK